MKLSYVVTFALITLALFTAATSMAQVDHNELGFYVDQEMSDTHVFATNYSTVTIHMIITHPFNEDLNQPVESINGLEFSFSFPSGAAIVLTTNWENGDSALDIAMEPNSHFIAWGEPLLNVNNAVYFGTKNILITTSTPFGVYLAPFSVPSIPGHMAFLEYNDFIIHPLYPTSGSYDAPVFGINTEIVATEETTFGGLKALFR